MIDERRHFGDNRSMTDEVAQARDALAFLERSRGRILEELEAIDAEIAEARQKVQDAQNRAMLDDDYADWLRGNAGDSGPVVVQS